MHWEFDRQFLEGEFDWLGVDPHGHVAAFISFDEGPLPTGVAQHVDEVDAAMKHVEELAVIGPPSSALHEMTGRPSALRLQMDAADEIQFWDEYAAKGFYLYHWGGSYVTCACNRYFAPPVLITVSQLPKELQAVAHYAEFTALFADAPEIVAPMPPETR